MASGQRARRPSYRLLVTAKPEGAETYAEAAHEALFRRWTKCAKWVAAEREFLAWKSGLESARATWRATADASKDEALLMGAALTRRKPGSSEGARICPQSISNSSRKASRATSARKVERNGRRRFLTPVLRQSLLRSSACFGAATSSSSPTGTSSCGLMRSRISVRSSWVTRPNTAQAGPDFPGVFEGLSRHDRRPRGQFHHGLAGR